MHYLTAYAFSRNTFRGAHQDGTSEDDVFLGGAKGDNGSVILVGSSYGDWDGSNKGGKDFVAVKLDADKNVLWKWQVQECGHVLFLMYYIVWSTVECSCHFARESDQIRRILTFEQGFRDFRQKFFYVEFFRFMGIIVT